MKSAKENYCTKITGVFFSYPFYLFIAGANICSLARRFPQEYSISGNWLATIPGDEAHFKTGS
jgi:hypothetical protein